MLSRYDRVILIGDKVSNYSDCIGNRLSVRPDNMTPDDRAHALKAE